MEGRGIVRRIDELGRIVIPKELRRTMRLNVGDEMEIVSLGDSISIKKFSRYDDMMKSTTSIAKLLAESTNSDVVVLNSTSVVLAVGEQKKQFKDQNADGELLRAIKTRTATILHGDDLKHVFENVECDCCYLVFEPIAINGDSFGGMAMLLKTLPSDVSRAYLKFCTELIAASLA